MSRRLRPVPNPKTEKEQPANSEVTSRQLTEEERERLGPAVKGEHRFIHWEWPKNKGKR